MRARQGEHLLYSMYYNYSEVKALSIEIAKLQKWTYTVTIPIHYKNLEKEGVKITQLIARNNKIECAFVITQKKRDMQWIHILLKPYNDIGIKGCHHLFESTQYEVISKTILKKHILIQGLIKIHCSYGGYHQYID